MGEMFPKEGAKHRHWSAVALFILYETDKSILTIDGTYEPALFHRRVNVEKNQVRICLNDFIHPRTFQGFV